MDDSRITRLISSQGKVRTVEMDDGRVLERVDGSASWRNNNPGNLKFEHAGSADRTATSRRSRDEALRAAQTAYDGVVGLDQWGNAVFESYEAGRAAKVQLLQNRHGDRTVSEMLRGYSRPDYSGNTNHGAQAEFIYREGDRQGVELRRKPIGQMNRAELEALADGIRGFEGWRVGTVRGVAQVQQPPERAIGSAAIYAEADAHFLRAGRQYEYGRPDLPRPGRDPSRLERDGDGDGKRGVDCSAFVWRALKNAGYGVSGESAAGFTTATLFKGNRVTPYATQNFDVISAEAARQPNGSLQAGDILMFASRGGQHVGIFKGYDAQGRIEFIGSQVSSGPGEVTVHPGGYWDGRDMRIVGALRAKPEFQVRAPLHANAEPSPAESTRERIAQPARAAPAQQPDDAAMRFGDRGEHVRELQRSLNRLGYRDERGLPVNEDSDFGGHTRHAVAEFQRDHGLKGLGVVGPRTTAALRSEEARLVTHSAHADHPLFLQVLDKVHAAEARRGVASGEHSVRLAATLAVEVRREGIARVDRVELTGDGSLARAVQVSPVHDEAALNRATDAISTRHAVNQPIRESSEQLAQVNANIEARQADEQQRRQAAVVR